MFSLRSVVFSRSKIQNDTNSQRGTGMAANKEGCFQYVKDIPY
jgi:hypothetical protein